LSDVLLRVVPIESILPHEIADPARESRIERRIAEDQLLRDPLLVGAVADVDGYVLLDGTNRRAALERLGMSLALVQVIDYADATAVELRTWCHSAPIDAREIVESMRSVDIVEARPLSPLGAQDALVAPDTLALVLAGRQRFVLKTGRDDVSSRSQTLRALVDLYETRLTRVDCEPGSIEERAHQMAESGDQSTLIAFPPFSRGQVVSLALQGAQIPAGITRHVIKGGRALRVNIPLDVLRRSESEASAALEQHLGTLHPRTYTEPTILFDS